MKNYITILEDLLVKLQINVAVARGFKDLEFPQRRGKNTKKYIDLWPIQMSANIAAEGKNSVLTTNFDTYTLILQLGTILDTVPAWKNAYKLRVAVFVEYETDVEEERSRVQTLLDSLRIKAEILVFWLASGSLKTYQIIINGDINTAGQEAEKSVDETLKDEDWWHDVQKLRGRHGDITDSEELVDTRNTPKTMPTWLSSSFQQGRGKSPVRRFEGLRKLIPKSRRRSSGDLNGVGLSMQTHRLHDDILHRHASHASASEEDESSTDDADSEVSESENSEEAPLMDDFEGDYNNEHLPSQSTPETVRSRRHSNSRLEPSRAQGANPSTDGNPSLTVTSDDQDNSTATETEDQTAYQPSRPRPSRQSSAAKFSSRPQPKATVNTEDGPGPSIMFTNNPSTPPRISPSIYKYPSAAPATGFPSSQSTPLSFNDLPCRAQHLILNELIQQHSKDTAVLFTTLPSPVEGTCENEEDCVSYLSDLEVLWNGLPPLLLIHSNSLTVTMNL